MIVKSNSVPNFLFEKPIPIPNTERKIFLKNINRQKVISYGETTKKRNENIKAFYDIVFKNSLKLK
jgi:hypothetical protein